MVRFLSGGISFPEQVRDRSGDETQKEDDADEREGKERSETEMNEVRVA